MKLALGIDAGNCKRHDAAAGNDQRPQRSSQHIAVHPRAPPEAASPLTACTDHRRTSLQPVAPGPAPMCPCCVLIISCMGPATCAAERLWPRCCRGDGTRGGRDLSMPAQPLWFLESGADGVLSAA